MVQFTGKNRLYQIPRNRFTMVKRHFNAKCIIAGKV